MLKKLSGTNTSCTLPEGVDPSKSWNTLASPAGTVSSTNHGRPESAATNHMISLGDPNQSHDFPWGAKPITWFPLGSPTNHLISFGEPNQSLDFPWGAQLITWFPLGSPTNHLISLGEPNQSLDFPWGAQPITWFPLGSPTNHRWGNLR